MKKDIPSLDIYPNYDRILERWGPKERFIYQLFPAIPRHVFLPFVFELYLAWVRLKSGNTRQKYQNSEDLLVNLGAGKYGKSEWVNVDAFAAPEINCIYDCRKSLPFPDNSVKAIFCEHFFEHIDYTEEVPYFLSECYRVLQVGGLIRLIVPDGFKYLEGYYQSGWDRLTKVRPLDENHTDTHFDCQYHTKMELINVVFRNGFQHKFIYDYETLEFVLYRYGFAEVHKQEYGKSIMSEVCIDNPHRESESIYVEAVKLSRV